MTRAARRLVLACSCVAALASPAAAQDKVYRCGPDGRSYSATPCADGREVPVADPRSASQRQQARAVGEREARLADQLAAERRAREAAAVDGPAGIKPAPSEPQAKPRGSKGSKPKADKNKKRRAVHQPDGAGGDGATFTARGKPAR